jgi:hypothetical protein
VDILKTNLNKECKVTVYNTKTQEMRGVLSKGSIFIPRRQHVSYEMFSSPNAAEVLIVPSDNWGGAGLLGARIRFCSFEGASENVWHILVNLSLFFLMMRSPANEPYLTPLFFLFIATGCFYRLFIQIHLQRRPG